MKCPHCDSENVSAIATRDQKQCRDCRKHWSERKGTVQEKSHLSPEQWEAAKAHFAAGRSANSLRDVIGCNLKTALRIKDRLGVKRTWSSKKGSNTTGRVTCTCPGCGVVHERLVCTMSSRCRACRSIYNKEYKAKRRAGWEPKRNKCEHCGELMSPRSKTKVHRGCAWLKVYQERMDKQEKELQEWVSPTKPESYLKVAWRELGRAQRAARAVSQSRTPSRPAATSQTSCPSSLETSWPVALIPR